MKFKFALPLMLVSAVASAEQYQSITDADYANIDTPFVDIDALSVGSQYYFGPIQTLGPRKEFSYILPVSNIYGGLVHLDADGSSADALTLGGEHYTGQWKVFGSVEDFEDYNEYSAGLGFLFTPNLLAEVEAIKPEDQDTVMLLRGKYNHQLGGNDYIGFTAEIDNEFDRTSVSTKYFTALSAGRYLTAGLSLNDSDNSGVFWGGEVEFFFDQNTSVGAAYDDNESYELNATHFFNRNVAAKLAFGSNAEFDDADVFSLGVTVQL